MEREPEIWKDINGYEGLYQISSHGRLKGLQRIIKRSNGTFLPVAENIKIGFKDKNGYLCAHLWKNNIATPVKMHRLVGLYFVDNPNNFETIDHLDFNKENNYCKNLEWKTRLDNFISAKVNGRLSNNANHLQKYNIKKSVLQIDKHSDLIIKKWDSISKASEILNISQGNISTAIKKNRNCGGFKWRIA